MRSKPKDFGQSVINRLHVAPAERVDMELGTFTASSTVTPPARFIADRRMRIEEIWFVGDTATPGSAGGNMTIVAKVFDVSENADDTIITGFDAETLTVAYKALKATLDSETSEHEHVMEAGDSLRFDLVSNAAIETNTVLNVLVIFKTLEDVIQ